jgi:hypothetical protein
MKKPLSLEEAPDQLKIDLRPLVAVCGYWSPIEAFKQWMKENGLGVWYVRVKRYKLGECGKIGQEQDGIKHDNNTYANTAIKRACGFQKSQRDSIHQPKVGRASGLPWVNCPKYFQPRRGCITIHVELIQPFPG